MTIQDRLWPHFRFDPEVIWEKQDDERDWLFSEWEAQEARELPRPDSEYKEAS